MGKHFQDFFLKEIIAYEKQHLDSKYPEFRTAMKRILRCIDDKYDRK